MMFCSINCVLIKSTTNAYPIKNVLRQNRKMFECFMIIILQNPLCARVLLNDKDRMSYYIKVRNPNLTYLARKSLRKQIQDKCKKVSLCPHCGDINGTIKKCGLLKISHEKFRTRRPELIMAAKLGKIKNR